MQDCLDLHAKMSVGGDSQDNQQRRYVIQAENPSYESGEGSDFRFPRKPKRDRSDSDLWGDPSQSRISIDGLNMEYDTQMEELLEQLPSRQLEEVADMAARTLWKKQNTLNRKQIKIKKDDKAGEEILHSLRHDLEEDDRLHDDLDAVVRSMPLTLSTKRNVKRQLSVIPQRKLSRWKLIKYWWAMVWQHFKYEMRRTNRWFDLWRSHLMIIEGCFGTSVVSYFIFLKWVLLINIPIFLLTFSFLVIPQILYRHYQKDPLGYSGHNNDFGWIELLTGGGFFEDTEMYYGFYTNETVEIIQGEKYNMKYAYLFTCGGYYLFCLLILGYSYLRSYRKYYIEAGGSQSQYYFTIVFCGWDYGITSVDTAMLKHRSIYNEFKEYLAGIMVLKENPSRDQIIKKWGIRVLTWVIVLALMAACGYMTFIISTELSIQPEIVNSTSIPLVSPLAMPVAISTIQFLIPLIFSFLESYEQYVKPKNELYVHMFREMALKATMLGVLVYFWLDIAPDAVECWETFVGQEIYRLTIIDLIFTLGYSFFMEFIRKLCTLRWEGIERAEFAIGTNTLGLIYSQTLCWLGIFYSPLLPVVVILKLIVIFYVKRISLLQNCRPSLKPWRASRTHTIYVGYLFIFFILSCVAVGYSILLIEPSKICGPYQNYTTTYEVVIQLVDSLKERYSVLGDIFSFINSPGFISAVLIFLGMILYYTRTVMISHREMVEQFKIQLVSEGQDKKFLINLLNQVKIRGQKVNVYSGPVIQKTMARLVPSDNAGFVFEE